MLFKVRVSGESCWPSLVPGKSYLATNLSKKRAGDFIVFSNPKDVQSTFVKKVVRVESQGYHVAGTVSWSSSSADFGIVPKALVLGKILFPERQKRSSHSEGSFPKSSFKWK